MARNMPTGVEVAPIGQRVLAWLIDYSVPVVVWGAMYLWGSQLGGSRLLVASVIAGLIVLAWSLLLWWGYASRGAGLGFQATGLQLVGLDDGKPIGWWRFFLRQLVFGAVMATVVGGIAMLIFLVIHERRQGWHDLAAKSVAIKQRAATNTRSPRTSASHRPKGPTTTVALPPHLIAAAFDSRTQNASSASQPAQLEQAWQASAFGGQAPVQETGWRPPQAPGQVQAPGQNQAVGQNQTPGQTHGSYPNPGQWNAGQSNPGQPHAGQSPAGQSPAGQQPQSAASQPSAPQHAGPQQPGRPQSAPSAPPIPAQWAPPAASQASAETTVRARPALADDDEYGGTRMVAGPAQPQGRPATEGWFIRLDDGRMVPLEGLVLIGRNPVQPTEGPEGTLVQVGEDGHAVSKTHLTVGVDQRGVHVTDRGSTNGTALVNAKGELEPCLPGIQARCREGQVVSFGDHSFTVMRRPA